MTGSVCEGFPKRAWAGAQRDGAFRMAPCSAPLRSIGGSVEEAAPSSVTASRFGRAGLWLVA
ncbi:MAG: hypothetical protein RL885_31425, partial [Planctomycetota bacterium]